MTMVDVDIKRGVDVKTESCWIDSIQLNAGDVRVATKLSEIEIVSEDPFHMIFKLDAAVADPTTAKDTIKLLDKFEVEMRWGTDGRVFTLVVDTDKVSTGIDNVLLTATIESGRYVDDRVV